MKKIYLLITLFFITQVDSNAQLLTPNTSAFTGAFYGDCVAADFNGDGIKEIIVSGALPGYDGHTALYVNQNGTYLPNTATPFTQILYSAIGTGDVNNDGHLDFAISGTRTDTNEQVFEIYYGNGDNTFTKITVANIQPTIYGAIEIVDFDKDGDMDILVNGMLNSGDKVSTIYLQNGNTGTFTVSPTLLSGTYFSAVKVFDANSDGFPDILITGYTNAYVPETKFYLNQGDGTFIGHNSGLDNVYFSSIDTADINGDGHPDVLLSGMSDSFEPVLTAYINNGAAHFTPTGASFMGTYYGSSRFVDYDNDGNLDILTLGSNADGDNKAIFYRNNGSGEFVLDVENSNLLTAVTMSRALVFDYDNDGDTDIFLMGYKENDVATALLYTNNSIQNCTPSYQYNADSNMITNVSFGDINNPSPFQSGTTPTYEDFSSINATVTKGLTYPIAVKGPSSSFPSDVMVYIDFNGNGNFNEAGEGFYIGQLAPANPVNANTVTANITIPATATNGTVKMRIIKNTNVAALSNPNAPNTITDPCDTTLRAGQTEDYTLTIENSTVCNQEPGQAVGDVGCVTFTYQGQTVSYATVRGADRNIWLQQNLGSPTVATSSTDANAFGDLFQWGRWDDGHQLRTATTATPPANNNPTGIGAGNPNYFTTAPAWWNSNQLTDTWSAATPSNVTTTDGCDPCRALGEGWKMPSQTDWELIIEKEVITSPAKAYDSTLKLTVAGNRDSGGAFNFTGTRGYYWSRTTSSSGAKYLYFSNAITNPAAGGPRGQGASVRCIKAGTTLDLNDNLKSKFSIYPNPTRSQITIATTLSDITVKLFNAIGQQVLTTKSNGINMANMASGIYIIQIQTQNGETHTQKIVKQ